MLIEAEDTSVDTVQDWETTMLASLKTLDSPVKRLYDMRRLNGVSIFALRTAVKLKKHPQAKHVFAAVLTNNNTVARLVNTALAIQPGGNFQLFSDEKEAVAWLNRMVP